MCMRQTFYVFVIADVCVKHYIGIRKSFWCPDKDHCWMTSSLRVLPAGTRPGLQKQLQVGLVKTVSTVLSALKL